MKEPAQTLMCLTLGLYGLGLYCAWRVVFGAIQATRGDDGRWAE